MERRIIHSDQAPAAIGPYSQAIYAAGQFVFTAGQLPIDPATGNLVEGGIEAQTRQSLANLKAVLTAAGTSLGQVVKTSVFLADIGEFQQFNAVYAEFFPDSPPARSTYQVAALPKGARVEIEAVALVP